MAGPARLLLCALIWLWSAALAASVADSQPADIAALRASQDRSAEHLRQEAAQLRAAAGNDRLRRAWATLALAEFENDLEHADIALPLLAEAGSEAQALDARDLLFAVRIRQSVVLVNRGKTAETDAILTELQQLVDASDAPPHWRADLLHERGVLARKLGRFDEALAHFETALAMQRKLGDRLAIAREQNSIGTLHGRTGRFSDAVLAHNEALALAREVGDRAEIARSLRLLGVLYRNLDDEELGSQYLREALEHVEERNRREAIALYGELAKSLTLLERYDEAEVHGRRAVELSELSGSPPNKVNAFTRMAELRLATGNIDDARRYVDRAFESFDSVAIRDQTLLRLTRVRVWAASGAALREQALAEARTTLADTRRIGDRILERATLDVLAELQLAAGDASAAFVTRKAHQRLDKELAMDVAARRIALLESSLERERSAAERALLERDNQIKSLTVYRQRLLGIVLLACFAALALVAAVLLWRYREARRRNAELTASRDQLAQLHLALKDSAVELQRVAHTDALTGLPNRHAISGLLERSIGSATPGPAARPGAGEDVTADAGALCVLLIDLDHFKQVNDQHGHLVGDEVLSAAAGRMRSALRRDAALGRWGGEEFLAVLPQCSLAEGVEVAERLRRALCDRPFSAAGQRLAATASFGVAASPPLPQTLEALVGAADAALYQAKAAGRNCVRAAAAGSMAPPAA